jgi:outer membrane protein OmpA-like peptidoglycan-associated protein
VRLQTQGLGPDRPVATNDNPDGRSQNRRVEITLEPITA